MKLSFTSLGICFLILFSHWYLVVQCEETNVAKSSTQLREEGDRVLREGDTKKAIQLYTEAIRIDSKDHHTFYKRAIVRLTTYQTSKALEDLNTVLELKPTFTQALKKKAKALADLCQYEEAINTYQKLLDQNLEDAATVHNQINLLQTCKQKLESGLYAFQQNDLVRAKEDFNYVLEQSPDCIDIRRKRMHSAKEENDPNSIIEHATRLLHLQSDDRDALFYRGLALYLLGQNEAAINHFRECIKYDHDDKRCQKEFKKIRKIEKATAEAHSQWEQNNFQEALDQFNDALQADPNNTNSPNLYFWQCKCYIRLKKGELAKQACSQALEKDDSIIEAILERAEAHILLKDYDSAVHDFHSVTSKQPGNRAAQEGLHRAQKLQKVASRKDYYKILQVAPDSSITEIKKAYRQLSLFYHPDKLEDKQLAETKIVEINEAYEILSDSEKRDKYDRGEDLNEPTGRGAHPFGFGGGGPFTFHFNF